MTSLILSLILPLFVFAAPQKPPGKKISCLEVEKIAAEAIKYHMTGAPTSPLPLTCAKKMKWRYFDPNFEIRTPDTPKPDLSGITWFDPVRDKYKIAKVERVKDQYFIDVDFVIDGKPLKTQYFYEPIDFLQRLRGVCGVIYNNKNQKIFRSDCRK